MTEVIMPKMGDGMEEGTLLEWLKKEGDKVKSGEILGTIQTDKATLELEAPGSGTLAGFLIKGGETVPVGKAIAALLKEGEKLPDNWSAGNGSAAAAAPAGETPPPKQEAAPPEQPKTEQPVPTPSGERLKASPLAKKIAAERGVDLAGINGSGPGGRIVERDVVAAEKTGGRQEARPTGQDKAVSLNRLRQITAQRTQQSKQQAPHFYVTVEVDVERILSLRELFEEEESGKVSINDFVVKACARALQDMPNVNATFQDAKTVLEHGSVNIGLAVALEDGLTLPVIQNAGAMSLREISAKAKELAGKARENKLHPDELSGSTFSISNMGMLEVDNFIAIINQPNAAILAISTARKSVVPNEDDELEVRTRMNITGSFDHRVVDGAVGAKFMNVVKGYLENPTRLLG